MSITINRVIITSNHMFKREIWDKFTELKISKNKRGKFSPNFTLTSSQGAKKGKSYTKNNQSISINVINITP